MTNRNSMDESFHAKMLQSGRNWMFASIAALTMLAAGATTAHADSQNTNTSNNNGNATNATSNDDNSQNNQVAINESSSNSQNDTQSSTTANSSSTSNNNSAASAASVSFKAANNTNSNQTSNTQQATTSSTTNTTQQKAVVNVTSTPTANKQADISSIKFSSNTRSQQFIESVAPGAIKGWQEYGVLPSITVAQAILESGWGQSSLSTQAHNLFGIKGSYNGHSITMRTREVYGGRSVYVNAAFRAYDNNSESVEDHGNFLYSNSRYHNLLGDKSYVSVANKLHADGYATDPSYASSLINLVRTYGLDRLDTIAFSGAQPVVTNKDNGGTTSSSASGYYTVQSGDNLSRIAAKFGTTYENLAKINNISNPNRIYVGQVLRLTEGSSTASSTSTTSSSTSGTYTVKSREEWG